MFIINIADLNIKINEKYDYVKRLCKNYITDSNEFDFEVCADETSIDKEIKASENKFSKGYCESVCIYREISKKLPLHDAFLMHAAVIELNDKSYAFLAKSGTGKSTHISLWKKVFGENTIIINGDKPIIKRINGNFFACGTPWCGKENYETNKISPLKAICFLERATNNSIEKIDDNEVLSRIFHQLIIPQNEKTQNLFFELLDDFLKKTPSYLLFCNTEQDAAKTAFNAMSN